MLLIYCFVDMEFLFCQIRNYNAEKYYNALPPERLVR